MPRLRSSLFVCALAAGLVATSAHAASAGEECEYLRKKEVEKAIDRKVKIGPEPTGVGGECSFTVRGAPLDVVNLWVLEGDEAKTGYKIGEGFFGDGDVRIRNLGDKAFYLASPFNTLYVLEDDTLVYLQYYLFSGEATDEEIQDAVVKLTKKALKRV